METIEALDTDIVNAEGDRLGIKISAPETRRNIATSGVPLNHLVNREFWVGGVRLRGTRLCEPCKYLDSLTRPGLMGGLIHRGGLRAQILTPGEIRVGDAIRPLNEMGSPEMAPHTPHARRAPGNPRRSSISEGSDT